MKDINNKMRLCASLLFVIFGIAADQISKYLAIVYLKGGGTVKVIPYLINFIYVENPGAAFGSLADHRWIFMATSCIAIVGILAYLVISRPSSALLHYSLLLIMIGGIGNMIDRISLEYVVDFIDFAFFEFPTFNIADCFVTIGAGMMVLWMVIDCIHEIRKKRQVPKKDGTEDDNKNA